MNNGDVIIISVPALTEERRRDLAKQAKVEAEDAKVGVRNARKDANTDIKVRKKEHLKTFVKVQKKVQNLTSFIRKVDELLQQKKPKS
jgi:ribosome recycling factor